MEMAKKSQSDIRTHFGNLLGFTFDELGLNYDTSYLQKETHVIALRSQAIKSTGAIAAAATNTPRSGSSTSGIDNNNNNNNTNDNNKSSTPVSRELAAAEAELTNMVHELARQRALA